MSKEERLVSMRLQMSRSMWISHVAGKKYHGDCQGWFLASVIGWGVLFARSELVWYDIMFVAILFASTTAIVAADVQSFFYKRRLNKVFDRVEDSMDDLDDDTKAALQKYGFELYEGPKADVEKLLESEGML